MCVCVRVCCNSALIDILHTFQRGRGRLKESAEARMVDLGFFLPLGRTESNREEEISVYVTVCVLR